MGVVVVLDGPDNRLKLKVCHTTKSERFLVISGETDYDANQMQHVKTLFMKTLIFKQNGLKL